MGKRISLVNVFSCYLKRFRVLFSLYQYERIVIEKELFPFLPSWAEYILNRTGQKYVVDYDDAVFHNYDLHSSFFVRLLLKNKIDNIMRYSHKVLAGNSYLADRARKAGASKVIIVPTVVDSNRYFQAYSTKPGCPVKVGWIGSPTTLKYLKGLLPVFEKLQKKYSFELVIIGGGTSIGFSGKETLVAWSEEGEVKEIQQLDIGIMPLTDSPWERGKCGYKLIQYMACGLPVVGSPVGVNKDLISEGGNGFLSSSENEWEMYLGKLISNQNLRIQMGQEGVKRVKDHYTLQKVLPTYLHALDINTKSESLSLKSKFSTFKS